MDTSTLLTYLENTLSSDNATRKTSETFLLSNRVTLIPHLLSFLVSNSNDVNTQLQLVALTLVKNGVLSVDSKDPKSIEVLNTTVEQTLTYIEKFEDPFSHNASILIKMSLKILDTIIRYAKSSYDEELSQFAHSSIGKGDLNNFYLGMLIVRPVARLHRHSANLDIINVLSTNFGAQITSFLQSYVEKLNSGEKDNNHQQISHAVLKLLNYMTTMKIPEFFATSSQLQTLCSLLSNLLEKTITMKDLKNTKWTLRLLIKLHSRAGTASNSANVDHYYNAEFRTNASQIVNKNYIQTISLLVAQSDIMESLFVSIGDEDDLIVEQQRCAFYFLSYLTRSLTKQTYSSLRPYLDSIIMNVLVPSLTIKESSVENYEDAPVEFLTENINTTDIIEGDVTWTSLGCLKKILKLDSEVTVPLVNLCTQLINQGGRNLACALNILIALENSLNDEDLSTLVAQIVQANNRLQNEEEMWLRSLIYDFLSNVRLSNLDVSSLPLSLNTNSSLPLLITSIKLVISKGNESQVNPVQLMQILLTIGEQENLEIVGELTDNLVERFPQQLGPYSCELITNIVGTFMPILEEDQNNSGGGEIENQLLGLLSNIHTIILASKEGSSSGGDHSAVIGKISETLTPIVEAVLHNGLLDYVESVIDICEALNNAGHCGAFHLETIVESFTSFGSEYFEFYTGYFQSVFFYGNENERDIMTHLIRWILEQNSGGLDVEDEEFIIFIVDLTVEMALCEKGEEEYKDVLQLMFNSYEDKQQFWDNKQTFRCLFAGMYKMSEVVISMFGNNVLDALESFQEVVNDDRWGTVFDLKIGIMGLMSFRQHFEGNEKITDKLSSLLSQLCDKVNPALTLRSELLKLANGEENGNEEEDGEFTGGDLLESEEFEELNKITVLNRMDVFGELSKYLGA